MPRPKTPYAKAFALGATEKHRERYQPLPASHSWTLGPLGEAPEWLKADEARCWRATAEEIDWLDSSHRGLMTIVAILRARLQADDASVKMLNLLRLCLQSMGATPATEHFARRAE